MKQMLLITVALSVLATGAQATMYSIDPYHSSVSFKVKHVVGKVTGTFTILDGSFNYDPAAPTTWSATANIDPASIKTGIDKRDAHLKTADFFDVVKYPKMTFVSTSVTDVSGNTAKLHGILTMHGVSKPVDLDLTVNGVVKDPMDKDPKGKSMRAGASAMGHVSRADFGIGATTGTMAGMVGTDVEIDIEVEGQSK